MKIEVFIRHCHFSEVSVHKKRYSEFSRKKCHDNFLKMMNRDLVNVTYLLDTHHPSLEPHFVTLQNNDPVIKISEGTETGSFLRLLDYVQERQFPDDTILYFLEDDYLHRERWADILLEAFTVPDVEYVTLYDHKDKYFARDYRKLESKLYVTPSCHWRTTPSTTNTYAMRAKTLRRDEKIHRKFSLGCRITQDHEKFCKLTKKGSILISSVPGWATHAEPEFASPCFNWESLFRSST